LTSASDTFTVADSSLYYEGMAVQGEHIPQFTIITDITGNTITISDDATESGAFPLRFFAIGDVPSGSETVSLTNGNATFTVADGSIYSIGMKVTGSGVPDNTLITGISSNTIVMSNNATITHSTTVSFFEIGVGNGTDTFNLPYLLDHVIAGVGGNLFGTSDNGLGKLGGSPTHLITANELPPHTHQVAEGGTEFGVADVQRLASGTGSGLTGNNLTAHTPMPIIQPTMLAKKCIRYQ
jgi:hypothetical protein